MEYPTRAEIAHKAKLAKEAAEEKDRVQRRSDDFKFMVLCNFKNNMAMYHLLRDHSLDKPNGKT